MGLHDVFSATDGAVQALISISKRSVVRADPPAVHDDPIASTAAPPPRREPRCVNRSRQRQQHELAGLRQQVIALQERIETLQGRGRVAPGRGSLLVPWKTVALDQRRLREQAERERDALRATGKDLNRAIKRVRRMVRERILRVPSLSALEIPRLELRAEPSDVRKGFHALACQLDAMDTHDDPVTLPTQSNTFPGSRVHYAQVRDSRLEPFDVATMAEAVWQARQWRLARMSPSPEEDPARDNLTVARRVLSSTCDAECYKGKLVGLAEARRYVRVDRHYILHCSFVSRVSDTSPTRGFEFLTYNCTIVSPAKSNGDTRQPVSRVDCMELCLPFAHTSRRPNGVTDLGETRVFCLDATVFVQQLEQQYQENAAIDLTRRLTRASTVAPVNLSLKPAEQREPAAIYR